MPSPARNLLKTSWTLLAGWGLTDLANKTFQGVIMLATHTSHVEESDVLVPEALHTLMNAIIQSLYAFFVMCHLSSAYLVRSHALKARLRALAGRPLLLLVS